MVPDARKLKLTIEFLRAEWRDYWDLTQEWREQEQDAQTGTQNLLIMYNSAIEKIFEACLKPLPEKGLDDLGHQINKLENALGLKSNAERGKDTIWSSLDMFLKLLSLLLVVAVSVFAGIGLGIKLLDGGVMRFYRTFTLKTKNSKKWISQQIANFYSSLGVWQNYTKNVSKDKFILGKIKSLIGSQDNESNLVIKADGKGFLVVVKRNKSGEKELFTFAFESVSSRSFYLLYIIFTDDDESFKTTTSIGYEILLLLAKKEFPHENFTLKGDKLKTWIRAKWYQSQLNNEPSLKNSLDSKYQKFIIL